MEKNFLGLDGLKYLWSKAKTWIAEHITSEATAKIAEIVENAPEDLDTLKEIGDWISTHANDAAAMNSEIKANTEAISDKADKSHTHTKSEITDFPTSLPANGGTAYKIEPDYTNVELTEVTSYTTKYIKLADCNWYDAGTLQVLLRGDCFEDTLVINFGGGNGTNPMLCGHYSGNSHMVYSVIAQKGSAWNLGYSIYVKLGQETNLTVNIALLRGNCTFDISESTTEPTNISEWPVSYGLFGDLTGGLIAPRQGTTDGNTVSIGRSDGNITIGATENNNAGYTTINNDCKMVHDLEVFGESNFVGPCFFNDDISVHSKSLFPSGYVPRTYYIRVTNLNTLTTENKALLKKLFAFMIFERVSNIHCNLTYKLTSNSKFIHSYVNGYGYTDAEGGITIDDNDNIILNSDFAYNWCYLAGCSEDGDYICIDAFDLANNILNNNWSMIDFVFVGSFTLLEKV